MYAPTSIRTRNQLIPVLKHRNLASLRSVAARLGMSMLRGSARAAVKPLRLWRGRQGLCPSAQAHSPQSIFEK